MFEKKTINEWEKIFDVQILDPDGFDRTDPNLYDREFTREEFQHGMMLSTCMSRIHKVGD